MDITKIHADDLAIVDRGGYTYIMTYSFPCQDLSLSGLGKGMKKGSGTRSGLLWEVERLLNECETELPHVLLMENVPQVIGEKNKPDFDEWCRFLESKGYSNYYQLLNAKDYGIPQNRNRCFMVSILGEYYYEFPEPIELKLKLKDMLEDNVNEKYYLNDKMIKYILNRTPIGDKGNFESNLIGSDLSKNAGTLTTKNSENGSSVRGEDTLLVENMTQDEIDEKIYLKVKNATKQGYLLAEEGDVDLSNLRIRKLTPLECWRLMGFSDTDFDRASKVNSANQLYKQAGNSIVVNVLMYIFNNML